MQICHQWQEERKIGPYNTMMYGENPLYLLNNSCEGGKSSVNDNKFYGLSGVGSDQIT